MIDLTLDYVEVDFYQLLGLPRTADKDTIKAAYKKQALKWHPDRHVNSSEEDKAFAEDRFRLLSEANEVLQDNHKRRIYDELLDADRPRASDGRHDTRAGNRSGPVTLEMTAELFTEDIHRLYVETKTIAPAPLPTFDPFDYPCAAPSGSVSAEMDDSGDSTSLDSVTEGIAPSHAFNSKSCRSELLEERRYYVTTPSPRGEHEDVHLTSDSDQESPHSFTDIPILPPKSTPTRTPTTDTAPGSKLQDMMDEQLQLRVEKETSAPAPAPAPAPAQAQTESEKKDLSKLPSWRKRYFA